jgi:sec-independent protein translocase protein TatC
MADPGEQSQDAEEKLAEAPLLSHLIELRSRLLKAMATVLVLVLCLIPFAPRIFTLVAQPLMRKLPAGSKMIATQVTAPFLTPFKTTFFVALFLAMPVVIYQLWAFVAPGLYRKEKRFAVPLLISSVILFYVGVSFAYWVVFPIAFGFFTTVAPEGVTVMTDINSYLDFAVVTFFSFGVAFEVPVATVLLIASGLVSAEQLVAQRSYVFLGSFVIGAVLTPPDVLSQCLLAIPIYLLFEGGILMSRLLLPAREAAKTAEKGVA